VRREDQPKQTIHSLALPNYQQDNY